MDLGIYYVNFKWLDLAQNSDTFVFMVGLCHYHKALESYKVFLNG
jgi:hypothetical protein